MQSCVFSIITPVFSVTWLFTNHSNMLICCSRKNVVIINVEKSCTASYFCWNLDTFIEIFCNSINVTFDQFNASLMNIYSKCIAKSSVPWICEHSTRFEAKHSLKSHQLSVAFHFHSSSLKKALCELTNMSLIPGEVLNKEMTCTIKQRYPDVREVHQAKTVNTNGISYKKSMIPLHKFVEIMQIWQAEFHLFLVHFRAFWSKCITSERVGLCWAWQAVRGLSIGKWLTHEEFCILFIYCSFKS